MGRVMNMLRHSGTLTAINLSVVAGYACAVLYTTLVLHQTVGGLFMMLALIPALRIFGAPVLGRLSICSGQRYLALVLVLCYCALLLQSIFQSDYIDSGGRSVRVFVWTTTIVSTLWMLVGASFSGLSLGSSRVVPVVLMSICFSLFVPNLNEYYFISYWDISETGAEGVNHLLVSEMALLLIFISYAFSVGFLRYVVIVFGGFLLFAGGGRTSFYLGVSLLLFVEFVSLKKTVYKIFALFFLVVLLALGVVSLGGESELAQRMLFSQGVSQDDSYYERGEFLKEGLSGLVDQFLIGSPELYAKRNRGVGSYIHNLLSAWQFYGFFVFLGIVLLIVVAARRVWLIRVRDSDPIVKFFLLCFLYAVIGAVASKFVGSFFLWLSLGYWCSKRGLVK